MAISGYKTSTGILTTNTNGFPFVITVAGDGTKYALSSAIGGVQSACGTYRTRTVSGSTIYEVYWSGSEPAGQTIYRTSGSYYGKYYSETSFTSQGTISAATICSLAYGVVGAGTINHQSGSIYNGYTEAGVTHKFTASPASGYKLVKIEAVSNGSVVASSLTSPLQVQITDDTVVTAYFSPSEYKIRKTESIGGSYRVFVNGTEVSWGGSNDHIVQVGDVVQVYCTPTGEYDLSYFVVDGVTYYPSVSSSEYLFNFTIVERSTDGIYDFQAVYGIRQGYSDKVEWDSTLGYVTVYKGNIPSPVGTPLTLVGGVFTGRDNLEYTIFASVSDSTHNEFVRWEDSVGNVLSTDRRFVFTQTKGAINLRAVFRAKVTIGVELKKGTSATTYDDVGACVVSMISHPEVIGTKYLPGNFSFSVTPATNWEFVCLYVEDLDFTGHTFTTTVLTNVSIGFNAKVVAVFRNTSVPILPEDIDQGNATHKSGVMELYDWEGSDVNKMMDWHSRRYVSERPMTIAVARVYADGYSDEIPKLKLHSFQSPANTDGKVSVVLAKKQDAFKMPLRRPEKYIEVEIEANHEVTNVALATSMEALWQE